MEKLHSKQFIIRFLVVGILLVSLFCFFLSKREMRIKEFDISSYPVLTEADGVECDLDYSTRGYDVFKKKVVLETAGYANIPGRETSDVAIHVVLSNVSSGKTFLMPTFMEETGFRSGAYAKDEAFMNDEWKVLLYYETGDNAYIIDTGRMVE